MSDGSAAEVVDEWQTGAGLVLGSALVGGVIGGFFAMQREPALGIAGFFVGGILTFLLLSYLFYGR
jgi:hypothetical protein